MKTTDFSTNTPPRLIAVARPFTRAWTQMTLPEIRAFAACLSCVSWKDTFPEKITLQKNALASILDVPVSAGCQPEKLRADSGHPSERLRAALAEMPSHSYVEFSHWDRHLYSAGRLITDIRETCDTLTFCFNRDYAALFGGLSRDYVTFLNTDIYQMSSRRSFYLYKELRTNCDSRLLNKKCFSDRDLKLILRVPFSVPGSYMYHAVRGTGSPSVTTVFDRSSFEKSVLLPALEDLSICRMISLSRDDSGSLFRKEKEDNRVTGYTLTWSINLYPNTPVRETHARETGTRALARFAKSDISSANRVCEMPVSPLVTPVPVPPSQATTREPVSPSVCRDDSFATFCPQTRNRFVNFPQHMYTSEDFERIELMKRMRGKTH